MENLFYSASEPKTINLERTGDGRLRLVISLSKLGQHTMLEYFLSAAEAADLALALQDQA